MKARYCQALSAIGVVAGLAASAPLSTLSAQTTRSADPNAPRVMVSVFRSADKNSGVQAADAIRTRLSQDVPLKQLWVVPKNDITATLEASGFPTNEALPAHDTRELARQVRADEYIIGQVSPDPAGGYRVDANLVLTRDNSLVQPLGSYKVDKADKAAGAISKEFRDAQKQFQHERSCVNLAREGKLAEAAAAARKGIAEYPKATLSRICLANVMQQMKAPADSVTALAQQILTLDPRSKPALEMVYTGLKAAGKANEATDALLKLVAADPSNTRLLEQVINELAANGQAAKAVPFVDQLVKENQGDPSSLLLQMRVHLAAKDYKGGIAAGEELMKADTASATADLFSRLSAAAAIDSQPQKAAELAARGVAKFPNNGDLLAAQAGALIAAGQTQQAAQVLDRAIAANPKAVSIALQKVLILSTANQDDQAFAALQQAAQANPDSVASVARVALSLGQQEYKAAQAAKTLAAYEGALRFLEFSNKLSVTPEAQFLLGATSFSMGTMYLQEAQRLSKGKGAEKAQACTAARNAKTAFADAQTNIGAGGKTNPQAAQQLLGGVTQYAPYADQFIKALCK